MYILSNGNTIQKNLKHLQRHLKFLQKVKKAKQWEHAGTELDAVSFHTKRTMEQSINKKTAKTFSFTNVKNQ